MHICLTLLREYPILPSGPRGVNLNNFQLLPKSSPHITPLVALSLSDGSSDAPVPKITFQITPSWYDATTSLPLRWLRKSQSGMEPANKRLTLDRLVTYQIKVPGYLDESFLDWAGKMKISVESQGETVPVTTITCTVDQAALHGLLHRLYSLGLPLISVNYVSGI
jgi:hypothetical protein